LGRKGLVCALQGSPRSPVQPERFALFGALASMTQKNIGTQIDQLEGEGLLDPFNRAGYRLLQLTEEGKRRLERLERTPPTPAQPKTLAPDRAPVDDEPAADHDEPLYVKLRAWQIREAKEAGLPPYFVLHDRTLRRIAASCPTTLAQLASIKGIGPRKLEQYGPAILKLIADHGSSQSQET
jgi:ATP-dependent DNA helicase RecQ